MGKGYNNYMCKKPFHPGSKASIKRAWMAEQKTENDKRKQEELKAQYEKEQNLYNNRALISSESKDKLELNFMYEAPPGAKRERQKEDDEPEFKFEWQRKYNAPREDYAKGNEDIKDQPFGIPVRNVRCIKCHKWGHINTDKECPLYNQASSSSMPTTSMDPMELMRQMKEDGFGLKENVLGHQLNPAAANQQFIPSDEESDPEIDFLKSLSSAEKKKLLKKLKKLSKKQEKSSNCKKKKKSKKSKKSKSKGKESSSDSEKGKKSKKKKSKKSSSSDSDSSSDESVEKRQTKKSSEKRKKSKKKKSKRSSSSDSDSSSDESVERRQTKKSKQLEPKEKLIKPENSKSKDSINLKELPSGVTKSSKSQSHEKSTKEIFEKNVNYDRYNSKEDATHKKVRNKSKQESSEGVKYKTKETKEQSQEKDSRKSHQEDFNPGRCPSKEDISHEKVRNKSPDFEKYATKEVKQEKKSAGSIAEKKIKYSSSISDDEKYQASKSEKFCNDISPLEKDSNSNKYPSLNKVKSELKQESSDHSKHKSKETKDDSKYSPLEKKVKKIDGSSDQAIKTEMVDEADCLRASKRKHEASISEEDLKNSNLKKIKYDHPDGFSHLCPQAHIKANYLQSGEEYEGKLDDEFRYHYREKRSPSVKQKYNK